MKKLLSAILLFAAGLAATASDPIIHFNLNSPDYQSAISSSATISSIGEHKFTIMEDNYNCIMEGISGDQAILRTSFSISQMKSYKPDWPALVAEALSLSHTSDKLLWIDIKNIPKEHWGTWRFFGAAAIAAKATIQGCLLSGINPENRNDTIGYVLTGGNVTLTNCNWFMIKLITK